MCICVCCWNDRRSSEGGKGDKEVQYNDLFARREGALGNLKTPATALFFFRTTPSHLMTRRRSLTAFPTPCHCSLNGPFYLDAECLDVSAYDSCDGGLPQIRHRRGLPKDPREELTSRRKDASRVSGCRRGGRRDQSSRRRTKTMSTLPLTPQQAAGRPERPTLPPLQPLEQRKACPTG